MGRGVGPSDLQSRVREFRLRAGLSQQQLAGLVGLTRQAISSIESGDYVPNTAVAIRLARALGCSVEDLFVTRDLIWPSSVHLVRPISGSGVRLTLAKVRGRWVGYPLTAGQEVQEGFVYAGGVLEGGPGGLRLLAPSDELEHTALLLGCDPSLAIVSAHLSRWSRDARLIWLSAPSERALAAVGRGEAHLAGTHLLHVESGEFNVPQARQVLAPQGGIVVVLAHWEQGLVVPPGNPKGLRDVADLARPDVTIVNREVGSGSRSVLDLLLARAGILPQALRGYDRVVNSHLAVVRAVACGAADAGIALRAVAGVLGMDFIPLIQTRFDLVVPRDQIEHPAVALLLDLIQGRPLRAELAALPGYDVSRMGTIVADIPAMA